MANLPVSWLRLEDSTDTMCSASRKLRSSRFGRPAKHGEEARGDEQRTDRSRSRDHRSNMALVLGGRHAHALVEEGTEATQAGEAHLEARLGDVVAPACQQGLRLLYAQARQELVRRLPVCQLVDAQEVVGGEVRLG